MTPKAKKFLRTELLPALKDIATHLEGGAPLHPGSLIFEEDVPAVQVVRLLAIKLEGALNPPSVEERRRIIAATRFKDATHGTPETTPQFLNRAEVDADHPETRSECPHCHWGFAPAELARHIRDKH